tara:strand:- start:667 stop:1473 length:807 start_codon:yes stop_codon:yes gene_type:complete
MFGLEKIENAYLLLLRYMIIVVATLALLASGYMVLNGFVKSMTGDPDLPTKSFVKSANNTIPTTNLALSWIPDSEKESMEEFIAANRIKGHYSKRMQDEPSLQVLANTFLTSAFNISYTSDDALSTMLFGDDGIRYTLSHSNADSSGSDNLNVLYLSMMRDHLENLNDLAPWFAQLSDDRRMDYQNHLLKETDGNVQRYLALFNNEWEAWVEDLGDEYDNDLVAAELRRASASMSYYSAGIAFALFLAVMFMSLIAFIERNTSKIANR